MLMRAKRKFAAVLAFLGLSLGLVAATSSPASASWQCTGVWLQAPYAVNVYGNVAIIGEVWCSGGGETRTIYATCVEKALEPWGPGNGYVWVIPDNTCTDDTWDAAYGDCNHYFRTTVWISPQGEQTQVLYGNNLYWDACI